MEVVPEPVSALAATPLDLEASYDREWLQDMLDMANDGANVTWPFGINALTARRFLEKY